MTQLQPRLDSNRVGDFYAYNPSKAAGVIFAILFLAISVAHIFQLFRKKTWFMIPVIIGGLMECLGYVARVKGSNQTPNWTLGPYVAQALLILVAPAMISASVYMILGRIILAVNGEKLSIIKKKWLTPIFVTGDVVSFLVLVGGSGMLTSDNPDTVKLAQKIILVGLFIQIVFFGLFLLVAVLFHTRMHSNPSPYSVDKPWQKHMFALYIVGGLILARSIVRIVEYIQGSTGYILSHEIYLYIFDAAMMFVALVVLCFVHPSEIWPGNTTKYQRGMDLEQM